MSYKGYSFNLHKEDDKELIDWLSNKKVTRTIKTALYNQMKSESNAVTDDNSVELLSAIKKVIESNSVAPETAKAKQREDNKTLDGEDADDFEKIFDI